MYPNSDFSVCIIINGEIYSISREDIELGLEEIERLIQVPPRQALKKLWECLVPNSQSWNTLQPRLGNSSWEQSIDANPPMIRLLPPNNDQEGLENEIVIKQARNEQQQDQPEVRLLEMMANTQEQQTEPVEEEWRNNQPDGDKIDEGNSMKTTGIRIYMREKAMRKARKHAAVDKNYECGGVLLGTFQRNSQGEICVVVTGIVRALRARRQYASVNFTPDTWAEIWKSIDRDELYSNETIWKMVGWYHTHPRFGIFLSGMDRFIHHEFFRLPGHVALVIDPVNQQHGFFSWDQSHIEAIANTTKVEEDLSDEKIMKLLEEWGLAIDQLPNDELFTSGFAKDTEGETINYLSHPQQAEPEDQYKEVPDSSVDQPSQSKQSSAGLIPPTSSPEVKE